MQSPLHPLVAIIHTWFNLLRQRHDLHNTYKALFVQVCDPADFAHNRGDTFLELVDIDFPFSGRNVRYVKRENESLWLLSTAAMADRYPLRLGMHGNIDSRCGLC